MYGFLFTVKYLREVTPYFRKNTALSELGWGSHDASHHEASANWSESKTIPLKLCYLCRNLSFSDPEKRTVELHSPDIKSSCILRFPDLVTASDWFNALHSNVTVLMAQALSEANVIMSTAPNQREIRHIGWLSEQVSNWSMHLSIAQDKTSIYMYQGIFFISPLTQMW